MSEMGGIVVTCSSIPKKGAIKIVDERCHCILCEGSSGGVVYHYKMIWKGNNWIEYSWWRDKALPGLREAVKNWREAH